MTDVNWKTVGGVSLIGGIVGYVIAWNQERRYRKHLVNKFGSETFEAEYDEEDMVHCNHCSTIIGNEKEVYDDETVEYEMANGEIVCIPCYKAWMEEYKRDLDPQYSPFYAETFEAPKWAGFCPTCNKWRTTDMSVKVNKDRNVSWTIPDKLYGKLLCKKRQRGGKIHQQTSSWTGYGQRWHDDSYCGTPLTKVKSKYKAESFEAPIKGAQPPRKSQDADGVYLTREHTKAIKKALKDKFPDTNWKVKKQGNSAVQFFGYSSPNENDPKRLEIDNTILEAIKKIENNDYGWEKGDDLGVTIYDESLFSRYYDAESKKTNEMDKFFEWILKENPTSKQITKPYSRKVDYLAQRYSDAELKTGLVNAFNAGDINHAKLFAAALGRQGFVSKYQAERKVY